MNKSKDQLRDQAARDYMELVFIYKRLGVADHIIDELNGMMPLNERGLQLAKYAVEEQARAMVKLSWMVNHIEDSSAE